MTSVDPTVGAGRREVLLLAAFAVLVVVGLWTVVVAELSDDTPSSHTGKSVSANTEPPAADTK
ncbi:MAG TPA: hypothetical protein VI299_03740 [Polyangiales bacterium]